MAPRANRPDTRWSNLPQAGCIVLIGIAMLMIAGCTSSARPDADNGAASTTVTNEGAAAGAPADAAQILPDDIPSCFIQGEPSGSAGPERVDVFQPAPRSSAPTQRAGVPATAAPRPVPDIASVAAEAAFPVYALDAPIIEITPLQMRVATVAAGRGRRVSLFTLQYRVAAQRGSLVITISSPSSATVPAANDLDDALDAIRLEARLPGTPHAADPLADPGAALRAVGCPLREPLRVKIEGEEHAALRVTWPGLPRVQILRIETGHGELTIEAGALDRAGLLRLLPSLVSLQSAPQLVTILQSYFASADSPALVAPRTTATQSRLRPATPVARGSPTTAPAVH
jgi:hypothetical protein